MEVKPPKPKPQPDDELPPLTAARYHDLEVLWKALHDVKRRAAKVGWNVEMDHCVAAVDAEIARRIQNQIL